jgi:uncharacterized protein
MFTDLVHTVSQVSVFFETNVFFGTKGKPLSSHYWNQFTGGDVFNHFIKPISILGLSLIVLLTVVGLASQTGIVDASAPAQTAQPTKRVISVSGSGTVTAPPDQATISIGVQITAASLSDATKQASDAMTKVLDAIKAQGVDAKEIQTSSYNINPITNYKDNQPSTITGYQVSNIVTVKVKNLDNVGKVLDAGIGAGANYLGGVSFGIADSSKYETDARTAAVKDATQVANTLATAAGVKLGNIVSIEESSVNTPPPVPYGRPAAADSAGVGPVETGSLDVTSNVVMVFEISE